MTPVLSYKTYKGRSRIKAKTLPAESLRPVLCCWRAVNRWQTTARNSVHSLYGEQNDVRRTYRCKVYNISCLLLYYVDSYTKSLPKILENLQYRFVPANKVALWQVFLSALQFSPVSIIPPLLNLITNLMRRTSRHSLWTFIQNSALLDVREQWPGKLRLQGVTYTLTTLTETAPGSGCLSTTTSA